MNIWFVCQGNTFNPTQGQVYLFAQNEAEGGRRLYHWDNVRRVEPGDLVINYARGAVRGVSIAKGAQPDGNGTRVDIDFFALDEPIDFQSNPTLVHDIRTATESIQGPIAVDGRTKQGYLFEFNRAATDLLRVAYGKEFPEQVRDLLGPLTIQEQGSAVIQVTAPLNTILYGPPGTGKTYNSIDRAVETADGKAASTHSANKLRFDSLRMEGRIEFVTFHQNYSYEDFLVGIRPDVDNELLRFQAQKGIFYRIARRARDNYEASKVGIDRRSFDDVLSELLEPLERGEEVPIGMASGISFRITEVSEKSLSFTKQSGGKDHTLSISTLRDVVEGVRDIPGGLDSYYKPLVKVIQERRITTEPAEKLKNYVLIIDEINRANISRVFGELITLLEEDKRLGGENELRVTLPNGEKDFALPPNLFLIGTMNTADKSIALIDIALRRRFEFIGYTPDYDAIDARSATLLREINSKIYQIKKSADYLIGHAYFMGSSPIEVTLRNKVVPLAMEYLGGKTDAVEQLFSATEWNVSFSEETYNWIIVGR